MTIREALERHLIDRYKHDRLYGRGEEYANTVIDSHLRDLLKDGFDCISKHESKSGEIIFYEIGNIEFRPLNR